MFRHIEGPEPSSANVGQNGAPQNLRDKRKKPKWFVLGTGTKSHDGSERRDVGVRRDLGMFRRIGGPEHSSANDSQNGAPQNLRDKRKELKWFVLGTGTKSQN